MKNDRSEIFQYPYSRFFSFDMRSFDVIMLKSEFNFIYQRSYLGS